jgi:hypothetical protein
MKGAGHTIPLRNNNPNLKTILNLSFPLAAKHQLTLTADWKLL